MSTRGDLVVEHFFLSVSSIRLPQHVFWCSYARLPFFALMAQTIDGAILLRRDLCIGDNELSSRVTRLFPDPIIIP